MRSHHGSHRHSHGKWSNYLDARLAKTCHRHNRPKLFGRWGTRCLGLVPSRRRAEAPAEATNPEEGARVSDTPPEAVGSDEPAVHDNPTPVDSGRDNAVRAAVEPLVSPYGDGVAVVYTPVDVPDGGFAINGDERMRSASMIKTLIMATLLQHEADGSISLGDSYTIRESDIVGGTGSVQSMGAGTRLSLSRLAELMISQSDNVATNVLIDRLGMGTVNDEGARLGLGQTVLARKMMDTAAAAAGRENYTSASD